jgi:hypothetical protein
MEIRVVVVARMSIDDKVCRDPRITVLAATLGWSRRETVGCLILDVWPICYDQECHLISERIIDAAAGRDGFAVAMIECELASRDRGGRIRISGAKERIEYLNHKKRAGRQGGLNSANSRAKDIKQTSSTWGSTPQAVGNPSVPDPVPASAPPTAKENTHGPVALAPGSGESEGLGVLKAKIKRTVADKAALVPARAWKAADYLRGQILAEDPKAAVSRQPWGDDVQHGIRLGWANEIRIMVERDKRTYEEIAEVLRFVFHEQSSGHKFVVQSPGSLKDKWDRIQAVRRNQAQKTIDKSKQVPMRIPLAGSDRR